MKKLLAFLLAAGLAASAQAQPAAMSDAPPSTLSAEERAAAVALHVVTDEKGLVLVLHLAKK